MDLEDEKALLEAEFASSLSQNEFEKENNVLDEQNSLNDESNLKNGNENIEDEYINIEMSRPVTNFGENISLLKIPNFIEVESKPFLPSSFTEIKHEGLDEESRAKFFVSLNSSIRWRHKKDLNGNLVFDQFGEPEIESNSRIVHWSDGSFSLHIGSEIYDLHYIDNEISHSQLFVHQGGSGLHAKGIFNKKVTLRTFKSKSADFHTALTNKNKIIGKKAKVIPTSMKNPDMNKEQMMKDEEERFRCEKKIEEQRKKVRSKSAANKSVNKNTSHQTSINDYAVSTNMDESDQMALSDSIVDSEEIDDRSVDSFEEFQEKSRNKERMVQMMEESD